MRDGKVPIFWGRDGRAKHACFDSPNRQTGIWGTLCGRLMPAWWAPGPKDWRRPEQLGLDCPQCCRSVVRLLEKREEERRDAERPTPIDP